MRVVILTEAQWHDALNATAERARGVHETLQGALNETVTEDQLGAVLAWLHSNVGTVRAQHAEARRFGDQAFASNTYTEKIGLMHMIDALRRAGITPFQGHE